MATFKALIRKADGAADTTAVLAGLTTDGSEVGPDGAAAGDYESVYVTFTADWEADTVPALTAGSIDQADPEIGDTLTVSGSNATGSATFQWQQSADGATGWSDISGATSASLDTSSGVTDDYYVRRQVSDGVQGPVATAAVQVDAVVAPSAPTIARVAQAGNNDQYNSPSTITFSSVDISAIPEGGEVMLTVAWVGLGGSIGITTPTLGGNAMTPIPGASNSGDSSNGSYAAMFRLARPAGSGTFDIVFDSTDQYLRGPKIFLDHVVGRTADVDTGIREDGDGVVTVNTNANGTVFVVTSVKGDTEIQPTFTNATLHGTVQRDGDKNLAATAKAEDVAAGTLTVTTPHPISTNSDQAVLALSIE